MIDFLFLVLDAANDDRARQMIKISLLKLASTSKLPPARLQRLLGLAKEAAEEVAKELAEGT